jgi:hypothetical protein
MKNDTFSPLVDLVQSVDQDETCFYIRIIQKNKKIRKKWNGIRNRADEPARFAYTYFCGSVSNFFLQPGAQK